MRRLKRLFVLFLCTTLFCAVDGHVFVLQTCAWAKMAYTFVHRDSVKVAVRKTFDGKHPCAMCKKISRFLGTPADLKVDSVEARLEAFPLVALQTTGVHPIGTPTYVEAACMYEDSLPVPPPTPPPKRG